MTRNEIKYDKIVNVAEDGEITILDYVFDDGKNFRGATGSRFYPVTREEYEEKVNDVEEIANYLSEATELPDEYKMDGYRGWAQAIVDNDEGENVYYDTSYSDLWDYMREELGLSEDEAYIFDCVGGGRCFKKDFQGNYNTELSQVIREYENTIDE